MAARSSMVSAIERALLAEGRRLIAGCDEAGRGALAGPVFAAAVVLDYERLPSVLADSKTLSRPQRELAETQIREFALACFVHSIDERGIEQHNILQASLLCMHRALESIEAAGHLLDAVLIDGLHTPRAQLRKGSIPMQAIVDGDAKIACISAAGILAKVARDAYMRGMAERHPHYGFEHNYGYGTPAHLEALGRHGPCELHRRSFAPVRELLSGALFPEAALQ
jgi:ribonuclease HII